MRLQVLRLRLKENFDRFNSKFTKEKEMVDFRRGITALGMFALFTGLAAAQVGSTGQQQLTCNTNVTVTPALRGEGYTEQTGDITITCTGGAPIAAGQSVPLVNIAVFYNTTVTSRLLPTTSPQSSSNTSEALLLIDEPGSGLPGFGPSLPQVLCATPLTGCQAWAGPATSPTLGVSPIPAAVIAVGSSTPAPNVYQGVVQGNSVTFFGVPVMPPTTTGSRVYRITNVRVNAQPLAGGSASGASPVQASISISGATSLSIQNSAPNVGYVSSGLSASASSNSLNQCSSATKSSISTITFTENFGTAFKTRVAAQVSQGNTLYQGQGSNLTQNVPGAIYNSESNFVFPINGTQVAGLADFGTRLKATFNNIPTGARIFVSTSNVNNNAFPVGAPSPIGGSAGNANVATGYVGYAQLVTGETVANGNGLNNAFFPAVTSTDNGPNNGNVPIAEVSISNNTGAAVWEVVNTNPNTIESFKFGVYVTYSANVAQNSPLPGTATVNLSFAPTATSGVASSTLPIPRFAGDSSAARNVLTINVSRTILLYPYITNQAGFDTGLTIANTSQDPFTVGSNATGAQAGSCKLTYYGGTTAAPTTPPGPSDTGNIAAGTVWVNTLQTIAPNFQGYMFAVCNFQYAHGFAFISDVGARNLAMGYLALVIPDPGTGSRAAKPGGCDGVSGCASNGEQDSH
jgi:hypothetical protein